MTPTQRTVLRSTSAGIALENMDIMFLSFTLSSIISTFHLSNTEAGWISTITNLGMLVGGILFGILADKYGRVKIFGMTVILFSLGSFFMAFAPSIHAIYFFRFLAGIGAGGEYGACMSLVAETFPKKKLGKASSVVAIGAQIGAILAALIAGFIIPRFGWPMVYLVGLLPILLVFFIRKDLKEPASFQPEKKEQAGKLGTLFDSPQRAWQTFGLCLMVTVQIAGYFGLMNWLPSIMQKQLGLSVSGSSYWMISTILGMCLGMLTFGTILDKFGPRMAYTLFLICSAISVSFIVLAHNQWSLLAAAVVVGYFINGMYGGYGAIISHLYPTEIRATANNFIMNTGRAVGGFSSILIGFLMDVANLGVVIAFLSCIYLVSCLTLWTIPRLKGTLTSE